MGIWIRTQDRRSLLEVNSISKVYNNIYAIKELEIMEDVLIGRYSTEQRALEILDEIQKRLTGEKRNIKIQLFIKRRNIK